MFELFRCESKQTNYNNNIFFSFLNVLFSFRWIFLHHMWEFKNDYVLAWFQNINFQQDANLKTKK